MAMKSGIIKSRGRRFAGWPAALRAVFCLGLLGAAVGCGDPLENAGDKQYNILLITIDTLRADRLGAYGYDRIETPALDRLAEEGVRFENAFTPTPLTLPAHTSLMTGTYPTFHGVRNNGIFHARSSLTTLAEVLKSKGYTTAAMIAAYVLDAQFGLDQGFDLYDDEIETGEGDELFFVYPERKAEDITRRAMRFLRKHGNKPFFLWAHYFDPHDRFDPPPRFAKQYGGRLYDGEVAYVDEQVGVLMKLLEIRGLGKSTLVIVAGDHGEGLMDHGEANHGTLVYDTTMRVPLIFHQAELFPSPSVQEAPVTLLDIMPTVMDLFNIEATPDIQPMHGKSLVPLLAGRQETVHDAIYFETLLPFFDFGWAGLRGIRNERVKYIASPDPELYDIKSDPGETNNLFADKPRVGESLHAAMTETVARTTAEAGESALKETDAEVRARLAALGYVSGAAHATLEGDPFTGPNPKDRIWVQTAMIEATNLFQEGRFEEAIAKLEGLIEEEPNNSHILLNLGMIYQELGRLQEAERYFEKHLELKPDDEKVLTSLSKVLAGQGRLEEAAVVLERIVEFAPERAGQAYYHIALIFQEGADSTSAEKYLLKAVEAQPDFADAYNNLGTLYANRSEYRKAIDAFEKAIKADPKMGDAHLNCGMCCMLLKKFPKAIRHIDRAQQLGVEVDPWILKDLEPHRK
jgi:arylsulfatase A-like enzyme/tetratricopeptide (TPR) repeat protein